MRGDIMFGDALKQLRLESKLTQKELAHIIGVSESTIGMYERNQREPAFEVLEAIADYFNVDMDYLTGRSSVRRSVSYSPIDNVIPLPRMSSIPLIGTIACGEPILAEENIVAMVDIPAHIRADFALRCKGNSMINARIFDGDIVYIRQQPTVDNGQIAAVLINDEATLKRVRLFPDHIVLEPENPQFRPLVYWENEMNSVRILGLAVAFTSMVR
jgi:repressor LexA